MQSSAKLVSQNLAQLWLSEALFWAHFLIIIGAVMMGLVLPWQVAVGLIVLHRLHLRLFDGCAFSRLQKRAGVLHESDDYLQQLSKRLFNYSLESKHVKAVDRSIVLLSLLVILAANFNLSQLVIVALVAGISTFGAAACWLMWRNQPPATDSATCQTTTNTACDTVKSSRFSSVFGIPIESLGFGYFIVLILAELIQLKVTSNLLNILHILLLSGGLITTVTFIILQVKVLKTLCTSCLNVHGASLSILLVQSTRLLA